MNKVAHHKEAPPSEEHGHGTTWSYVIGFALSLLFTAIPYQMVVNQTATGTTLLATIIGIAVLQMIIQIVFFLHLGRGPKPLYNVIFFVFTVGTIILVVVGSIWIMNHLNYNMAPTDASKYLIEQEGIHEIKGEKTGACEGVHDNHKVIITNGIASPIHVSAKYCDSLTFINEDDKVHEISFGSHEEPGTYAGQTDLPVRKGRGKTITLNQAGTYQFFDHHAPKLVGTFTVTEH